MPPGWICLLLHPVARLIDFGAVQFGSTIAHIAAVVAGLAIVASAFTVSRKGLFPGLAAAVVLAATAALLIAAARGFG